LKDGHVFLNCRFNDDLEIDQPLDLGKRGQDDVHLMSLKNSGGMNVFKYAEPVSKADLHNYGISF